MKAQTERRGASSATVTAVAGARACVVTGCRIPVSQHWAENGEWTPHEPREAAR